MARELNKLTITATQMMESMIALPVPTRAEVSDVANAVLDGTDAVMLSAETRRGPVPGRDDRGDGRICVEAEKSQRSRWTSEFLDRVFTRVDQSIAMAALFTAYHLKVKAIAALTESGSTALWMSRLNCGVPIYALTPRTATRYRLTPVPRASTRSCSLRSATTARSCCARPRRVLVKSGAVGGRRPHRDHHRRAHRQVRRHQHDEDRARRRTRLRVRRGFDASSRRDYALG